MAPTVLALATGDPLLLFDVRGLFAAHRGGGLAKVEPTSPNVLIAYSAKAGSTAADGDGTGEVHR